MQWQYGNAAILSSVLPANSVRYGTQLALCVGVRKLIWHDPETETKNPAIGGAFLLLVQVKPVQPRILLFNVLVIFYLLEMSFSVGVELFCKTCFIYGDFASCRAPIVKEAFIVPGFITRFKSETWARVARVSRRISVVGKQHASPGRGRAPEKWAYCRVFI